VLLLLALVDVVMCVWIEWSKKMAVRVVAVRGDAACDAAP